MYQPHADARSMSLAGNNMMINPNSLLPIQLTSAPTLPLQPDIKLKRLPFYDIIATLLPPSTLIPSSNLATQEASFNFTLTPQQATEIASNRDMRLAARVDYPIQVQLRFCLLDTSIEQDDCFPPGVIVKVNNKICPLPCPVPTNRPNTEPKRPPRPVNVTPNVKLSPTVTNTISVQWTNDLTKAFTISAFLVRKLSSQQLLVRMKSKGIKKADFTRSLIKEKLKEDADCEIATTMLKVSLMCPLGKMRMSIPCRATTCSHLQCFDALLFLQMNERKPTWNCPVCDKPAIYDTLVIDGYFQEVLGSPLLSPNDNEIQLLKDGSWSTHIINDENHTREIQKKVLKSVEVIGDDIEVITEVEEKVSALPVKVEVVSNVTSSTNALIPGTHNEPSSTSNVTVDLTLSDCEDDLPLVKKKLNNNSTSNKTNLSSNRITSTTTSNTVPSHNTTKSNVPKFEKSNPNDLSIISLDSPSPPSSPIYNNENGVNGNNNNKNNNNNNNHNNNNNKNTKNTI